MLFHAHYLRADVLGVSADGGGGNLLHMVSEVRAGADAARAILGAVAGPLGLGTARVAPEAGEGLRGNAAKALDQPHDYFVALRDDSVAVVERLYRCDVAATGG